MTDGKKKFPSWSGRPVVRETDIPALEHRAAILEFQEGLPRASAEDHAHREYLQDHHRQAAAHHLRGLRASGASGDSKEAERHSRLYDLHLQALGADSFDGVPKEIQDLVDADDRQTHTRFRTHGADRLLLKADVLDFGEHRARKEAQTREAAGHRVQGVLEDALATMASDPGFQEAGRKREVAAKEAKLKAGPALFKPGQKVLHVDQQAVPWIGTVASHGYREADIDGPGHYYEVRWWNPKLRQHHEDYLHQDHLRSP